MAVVASICIWVAYLAAWAGLAMARESRGVGGPPRPTAWGVGLWCAVAIPSLLQIAIPSLLALGQRDPAAIADGQWWRLVTSMFLQDGGWLGTAFNLVTLAVSVTLVRDLLPGTAMIALFLVGGVVCNALTLLVWPQPGAGNSMATLFLTTAAVIVARPWRARRPAGLAPIAVPAVAAVVLLALRDQHGLALASGLLAGGVLAFVIGGHDRHRPPSVPDGAGA